MCKIPVILNNIPLKYHLAFSDALTENGFVSYLDPNITEIPYGSPVLIFALGFISGVIAEVEANKTDEHT